MTDVPPISAGPGESGREPEGRLAAATPAFTRLTGLAARRERITYADFAFDLVLGSPRNLGWLLTPLLRWCEASRLPPLPIIVVRRADGLPSGGYDRDAVAAETQRCFDYDWGAIIPPTSEDLARFAMARTTLPAASRGRAGAGDTVPGISSGDSRC